VLGEIIYVSAEAIDDHSEIIYFDKLLDAFFDCCGSWNFVEKSVGVGLFEMDEDHDVGNFFVV